MQRKCNMKVCFSFSPKCWNENEKLQYSSEIYSFMVIMVSIIRSLPPLHMQPLVTVWFCVASSSTVLLILPFILYSILWMIMHGTMNVKIFIVPYVILLKQNAVSFFMYDACPGDVPHLGYGDLYFCYSNVGKLFK
jgi:ABC-type nitrate/sulfonate/bicarbonate transport system permease component